MTEEKCEFKSAQELGLTHEEWAALITILPLLERDVIRHAPGVQSQEYVSTEEVKPVFNMEAWREQKTCGTAMCIGGSAEWFGKLERSQLSDRAHDLEDQGRPELVNLFYPYEIGVNWDRLTPQMAAVALRHYLTTGKDGGWTVAAKKFGYEPDSR